uniref:Fumarylacetoacetate hydrolase domaincontaining protein 2like [Aplysia californica] n=1 Tax=Lepeophtheirus salmonis TaxID=72036 RepID=A0A0K2TKB2_LEPSM
MRIVQYRLKDEDLLHVGVLHGKDDDDLIELPWISDTYNLIQSGPKELQKIKNHLESGKFSPLKKKNVEITSPIFKPDKVLCIGMNYKDHCIEQNLPTPKEPIIFNKFPSCICGPFDDIKMPNNTKELDWEVELAVVMSKTCKNVSKEEAMEYVFGYTTSHDVSARDWQIRRNGGQWLVGKAMDGFCPLGPCIVTTDELKDPNNLEISCSVNGNIKQSSNTKELVFKIDEIVSWISNLFTLYPGDVILTGTPPGVGVFLKPPQYLKVGDVVECKISSIGSVINKIV